MVVDALVSLSMDPDAAQRALKLSARQRGDIDGNRVIRSSPTMAAVDRYTGVLYDALDAVSLDSRARDWLGEHVWIHSAPFGPVGALDGIPAYRLAAGTSLPGVAALRRIWAGATTAAIAQSAPAFVLDLRSEAYAALGPVPSGIASTYVRVVTDEGRALNHFNKKSKGELVRALAQDAPIIHSLDELQDWALSRSIVLRPSESAGVTDLVIAH